MIRVSVCPGGAAAARGVGRGWLEASRPRHTEAISFANDKGAHFAWLLVSSSVAHAPAGLVSPTQTALVTPAACSTPNRSPIGHAPPGVRAVDCMMRALINQTNLSPCKSAHFSIIARRLMSSSDTGEGEGEAEGRQPVQSILAPARPATRPFSTPKSSSKWARGSANLNPPERPPNTIDFATYHRQPLRKHKHNVCQFYSP